MIRLPAKPLSRELQSKSNCWETVFSEENWEKSKQPELGGHTAHGKWSCLHQRRPCSTPPMLMLMMSKCHPTCILPNSPSSHKISGLQRKPLNPAHAPDPHRHCHLQISSALKPKTQLPNFTKPHRLTQNLKNGARPERRRAALPTECPTSAPYCCIVSYGRNWEWFREYVPTSSYKS